jgi:hypothetical protein
VLTPCMASAATAKQENVENDEDDDFDGHVASLCPAPRYGVPIFGLNRRVAVRAAAAMSNGSAPVPVRNWKKPTKPIGVIVSCEAVQSSYLAPS